MFTAFIDDKVIENNKSTCNECNVNASMIPEREVHLLLITTEAE